MNRLPHSNCVCFWGGMHLPVLEGKRQLKLQHHFPFICRETFPPCLETFCLWFIEFRFSWTLWMLLLHAAVLYHAAVFFHAVVLPFNSTLVIIGVLPKAQGLTVSSKRKYLPVCVPMCSYAPRMLALIWSF